MTHVFLPKSLVAAVLLPGLLLIQAVNAHASPEVDAGRAAYQRGQFRVTLEKMEAAERSPTTTEEELVDAYWLRGASYHALGKTKDAEAAIDRLLALRPLYVPSKLETPPDLRALFKRRRDAYEKEHGVNLGTPFFNKEGTLVVPLSGHPAEVTRVNLFARAPGEVSYRSFEMRVDKDVARGMQNDTTLWERVAKAGKMELVLEALNGRDVPIARSGDARNPVSVNVDVKQAESVLASLKPAKPAQPASDGKNPTGAKEPATTTQPADAKQAEATGQPVASGTDATASSGTKTISATDTTNAANKTSAAATPPKSGGGKSLGLRASGIALLASSGLLGGLAVLGVVAAAVGFGSFVGSYWAFNNVVGLEVKPFYYPTLAAWYGGIPVGLVGVVLAGVGLLISLVAGIGGVALVVVSRV